MKPHSTHKASQAWNDKRLGRFLSYYKPYRLWLVADLGCAAVVASISLILPLMVRHVAIQAGSPGFSLLWLGTMMAWMLGLVGLFAACEAFVSFMAT